MFSIWGIILSISAQAQNIRLQYRERTNQAVGQEIKPYFKLYNDGASTLTLSDITVRYWFTSEPPGADVMEIDYAAVGTGNITSSFGTIGGERYVEFGFTSSATISGQSANQFPAGATTNEVQPRLHDAAWGSYDQNDDFSYDNGYNNYSDYTGMSVYYQGYLVWGAPPPGATEAETMSITQQPTNTTAGNTISPSPTIRLLDGRSTPEGVAGIEVTVIVNQNSFAGGSISTVVTDADGYATFDALTLEDAASGYTLTFDADDADASLISDVVSGSFEVTAGTPTDMTISVQPPSSATAGTTISANPAVTVTDTYGNPVSGVDIDVVLNKNSFASGTTTQSTNSSGVATFTDLVIQTAATGYQVTFDADVSGVDNELSTTFSVVSAAPASMSIVQQPLESVVTGVITGPPSVKLVDAFNNPVSGVNITVSETGSYTFDAGTLTKATNTSGIAAFNDLSIATAGTDYQLTYNAASGGVSNINSALFDVLAAGGSMSVLVEPTQTVAGVTISPSFQVEVLDGSDNPISGASVTISLNQNSFASGTLTRTTNGSGVATFNDIKINTADEDYVITFDVDYTGIPNIFSAAFDIVSSVPTTLSVSTQPNNTAAGNSINGPPSVLLADTYGNPVSGVDVVVTTNQNSFASGTTTIATNSSGIAAFSNLVITTKATGYQLTFNPDAGGVSNAVSNSFNVTAAAASNIVMTVQPTDIFSGEIISPSPKVTVTDTYGNLVSGKNVTATLDKNSFSGGSTTVVATNSSGVATFSNLKVSTIDTDYQITFSTTSPSLSVNSSLFNVNQPNPAYGSIRLQYENHKTNSNSNSINPYIKIFNESGYDINYSDLTIRYWFTSEPSGTDQFFCDYAVIGSGNVSGTFDQLPGAGNYYMEVGFSSLSLPNTSASGDIQIRVQNNGSGNYTQSDDYSFDSGVTTYADYDKINVYYNGVLVWGTPPPGATEPESITITQQPGNSTAGSAVSSSPTVLLKDALDNPVPGIDVTATVNQNSLTPGSTTIVTTNASGLAVFSNLVLETAATGYTITFDPDASLLGNATSNNFNVTAASPSSMSVTTQPSASVTAGSTLPGVAITMVDAYGNPTSGENVTISTNQSSINSGTLTKATNTSGVATFSDLIITTSATGYQFIFDASAGAVDNVNSNNFAITASAASSMSITQQPLESVVTGFIEGPPSVTLTDTYGNLVPGANVTVTTATGYVINAGTLTKATNSSGVAIFDDLSITTPDIGYRLVFDPAPIGISNQTSDFFDVTAPTGSMEVTVQPATQTAAGATMASISVELVDLVDAPISGVDITIALNKNNFASGTVTKSTNGSGIAVFDDLVITEAAEDYVLIFDADQNGVPNISSDTLDISAGAAVAMSISTQPGNTPSGISLSGPPAVTLVDTYGNPVPGVNVDVVLNQNSFNSGTTTKSTNSFGIAEFDDLIITTITTGYQLTFQSSGLTDQVSGTFSITNDIPSSIEITVQPGESVSGVVISPYPTVLVKDAGDNPVPGVNVVATLNKNSITPGSTIITTTNSSGLAIFTNLKITTVDTNYDLTFTVSGITPEVSNSFDVIQENPPFGTIRLQYQNNRTNLSSNFLQPYIRVFNDSDLDISFSELTVRYWFSSEPTVSSGNDQVAVDYAEMGNGNVSGTFGDISGEHYLELSFSASTVLVGGLGGDGSTPDLFPADARTGQIQLQITASGGTGSYDQSNDYSFDAAITTFADYDSITVYYKGQLVWGSQPSTITETYYSRQSGNWDVGTNWSTVSHIGPVTSIPPSASDTVIIGNAHVISLPDNIAQNVPVIIDSSGMLNTNSFTLSGSGDFTLLDYGKLGISSPDGISSSGSTGNIQNTGTRTFSTLAHYIYNGSSSQVLGSAIGTQIAGDLTIDNIAGVTAGNNLEVQGTLYLNEGSLIIQSGDELIANEKSIESGSLILERVIDGTTGWRMLSSPLLSDYEDFLDSTLTQGYDGAYYSTGTNPGDTLQPNVMYYDETYSINSSGLPATDNDRWRAPTSASIATAAARGHYVFFFGDIDADPLYNDLFDFPLTLTVQGQEHDGDGTKVDFGITYTPAADSGWNLVGNPYASTIDWDDSPNWTKTNLDNVIYVWDPATSSYKTWNGSAGDLTSQGLIAPFQAFWVKANAPSPVLQVYENAKTFGGVYTGSVSKEQPGISPVISLTVSSGNKEASIHIMFSEQAEPGKDYMDAYRLLPPPGIQNYIDLCSVTKDDECYAINNLPRYFGKEIEIPVVLDVFENGQAIQTQMKLNVSDFENIPEGWSIQLVDNETRKKLNLNSTGEYTFNQITNSDLSALNTGYQAKAKTLNGTLKRSSRFTLLINPGEDTGGLPSEFNLSQNYPNPFNPSTKIQIDLPIQDQVSLEVYDILGRHVSTLINTELRAGTHIYTWNADRFASGIYIYRFITSEGVFVKKMTLIK